MKPRQLKARPSRNLTVFCAYVMIGSSAEITPAVDRILVVDDLPDNCFLLQTVLESEGYEVEVANNGRVALESIASHPSDLVSSFNHSRQKKKSNSRCEQYDAANQKTD